MSSIAIFKNVYNSRKSHAGCRLRPSRASPGNGAGTLQQHTAHPGPQKEPRCRVPWKHLSKPQRAGSLRSTGLDEARTLRYHRATPPWVPARLGGTPHPGCSEVRLRLVHTRCPSPPESAGRAGAIQRRGARPSKARQAANAAADDGKGKEPVKAICATGRKKGKLSSREEEEASFFRGQLQLW